MRLFSLKYPGMFGKVILSAYFMPLSKNYQFSGTRTENSCWGGQKLFFIFIIGNSHLNSPLTLIGGWERGHMINILIIESENIFYGF